MFFCRFTVEANKSIKESTIITEYVVDVNFLKNPEYDVGDSIMTLIFASNPSRSLVIFPDKHGSIARSLEASTICRHDLKEHWRLVRFQLVPLSLTAS